jgi:hypothetical protein
VATSRKGRYEMQPTPAQRVGIKGFTDTNNKVFFHNKSLALCAKTQPHPPRGNPSSGALGGRAETEQPTHLDLGPERGGRQQGRNPRPSDFGQKGGEPTSATRPGTSATRPSRVGRPSATQPGEANLCYPTTTQQLRPGKHEPHPDFGLGGMQ